MKMLFLFTAILVVSCSSKQSFDYKPVKFGFGEGYEEVVLEDNSIQLRVISLKDLDVKLLEHYFHFRASERCNGYNYQLFEFSEMIDVCSSGGCFKKGLQGRYKCA